MQRQRHGGVHDGSSGTAPERYQLCLRRRWPTVSCGALPSTESYPTDGEMVRTFRIARICPQREAAQRPPHPDFGRR